MIKEIGKDEWDEKVEESDNAVLVEFMLPSCPVCQNMEPILKEVASSYDEELDVYKVHARNEQELSMKYGVQSTPTFIFLCKGEQIAQLNGGINKTILENTIKHSIKSGSKCADRRTTVPELTGYR